MADQFDPEELRKLTEALKESTNSYKEFGNKNANTTTASATSFDKGTAKIVNGLGLLAAQLTKNAKSEEQKKKYMDEFGKSVEKATKAQDEQTKAVDRALTAENKITSAKERSEKAAELLVKRKIAKDKEWTTQKNKEALELKLKEETEAAKKLNNKIFDKMVYGADYVNNEQKRRLEEGYADLGKLQTEEEKKKTDALRKQSDTEKKMKDLFEKRVNDLGVKMKDLFKEAVGFGSSLTKNGDSLSALGGVIDVTTKLFGALVSGIPFAGGALKGLGEAGAAVARLMLDQFEAGLKAFKDLSSTGLVTSFENMRDVANKTGLMFGDINAALKKNAMGMANYGGSVTNGVKAFAAISAELKDVKGQFRALGVDAKDFSELQAQYMVRQNNLGKAQQTDLKKGTIDYITQLNTLTQLTGESNTNLAAQLDKARSETKFAASLENMSEKAQQTFENANIILEKKGAIGTAQGVRDLASGSSGTDAASSLIMQTGGKATQIIDDMRNGLIDQYEAVNQIKRALKETQKDRAYIAQHTGDNEYTKNFAENRNLANSADITPATLAEIDKSQENNLKGVNAQTTALTNAQQQLYDAGRDIQNMATSSENAAKMLNIMSEMVKSVTGELSKMGGKSTSEPQRTGPVAPKGPRMTTGSAPTPVPGGTPADAKVSGGAKGYLEKMIQAESGGRNIANQSGAGGTATSSAFGLAQITKGTFKDLVDNAGRANPLYGKTFEDMKSDTNLQMEAAKQLTDENRKFLESRKLPTTDAALYLAHFLGAPGAAKALSQPDSSPLSSVMTPEQIAVNPNLKKMTTVADLKKWADQKMGGSGYKSGEPQGRTGGIFRGPSTGYNVELHGDEVVVPANDGVSKQALNTSVFNQDSGAMDGLLSMFSQMNDKFDQMVDLLATGNDHREKLVQATA